jgi:hypothetical protein
MLPFSASYDELYSLLYDFVRRVTLKRSGRDGLRFAKYHQSKVNTVLSKSDALWRSDPIELHVALGKAPRFQPAIGFNCLGL